MYFLLYVFLIWLIMNQLMYTFLQLYVKCDIDWIHLWHRFDLNNLWHWFNQSNQKSVICLELGWLEWKIFNYFIILVFKWIFQRIIVVYTHYWLVYVFVVEWVKTTGWNIFGGLRSNMTHLDTSDWHQILQGSNITCNTSCPPNFNFLGPLQAEIWGLEL